VWITTVYFTYITFKCNEETIQKKITKGIDDFVNERNTSGGLLGDLINYIYQMIRPSVQQGVEFLGDLIGDVAQDVSETLFGTTVNFSRCMNASKNLSLIEHERDRFTWSYVGELNEPDIDSEYETEFFEESSSDIFEFIEGNYKRVTAVSVHNLGDWDLLYHYLESRKGKTGALYNKTVLPDFERSYDFEWSLGFELGTYDQWLKGVKAVETIKQLPGILGILANIRRLRLDSSICSDFCTGIILYTLGVKVDEVVFAEGDERCVELLYERLGTSRSEIRRIQTYLHKRCTTVKRPELQLNDVLDERCLLVYDSGSEEFKNMMMTTKLCDLNYTYFAGTDKPRVNLKQSAKYIDAYFSIDSQNGVMNALRTGLICSFYNTEGKAEWLVENDDNESQLLAIEMMKELDEWLSNELFTVQVADIETLFSSENQGTCVIDTIEFLANNLKETTMREILLSMVDMLEGQLLTVGHVFLINLITGFTIVVGDDTGSGVLIGNEYVGEEYLYNFYVSGEYLKHIEMVELSYQFCEGTTYNDGFERLEITDDICLAIHKSFCELSKKRAFTWKNWYELIIRKETFLCRCTILKQFRCEKNNTYLIETNYNRGCSSVIVLTNEGWQLGWFTRMDDQTILRTYRGQPIVKYMIVLKGIYTGHRTEMKIDETEFYALNISSQQMWNKHKMEQIQIYKNQTESPENLVIFNFDNRLHHKYNDWHKIDLFKRVYVIDDEGDLTLFNKNYLKESFDRSFNRLSIWRGQVRYCAEFSSVLMANCCSYFFEGVDVVNKTMYYKGVIEDEWFEIFLTRGSSIRRGMITDIEGILQTIVEDGIIDAVDKYERKNFIGFIDKDNLLVSHMYWVTPGKDYIYIKGDDAVYERRKQGGGVHVKNVNRVISQVKPKWWLNRELKKAKVTRLDNEDYLNFKELFNYDELVAMADRFDRWYKLCPSLIDIKTSYQEEYSRIDIFEQDYENSENFISNCAEVSNLYDMDYWLSNDHIGDSLIILPNRDNFKFRFVPKNNTTKFETYKEYPERVRPLITKGATAEERAVASRLYGTISFRIKTPTLSRRIDRLLRYWFKPKVYDYIGYSWNAEHLIDFDEEEIFEWVNDCLKPKNTISDLNKAFGQGFNNKRLNDVKVHLKIESVLKDELKFTEEELHCRVVVWQARYIAAIFSSVFKEVKKRIKKFLLDNVLYSDGCTYNDINNFTSNMNCGKVFICTDLKKQDRQTDLELLEVEMNIFLLFGVAPHVVKLWSMMHYNWRWLARQCVGWRHMFRHTGSVTTALGNLITDLQCNTVTMEMLDGEFNFAILLGDDNTINTDRTVNKRKMVRRIKNEYNIESTVFFHEHVGDFCGMLMYQTEEKNCHYIPDIVKLHMKYQVPNLEHEELEGIIEQRAEAYLNILGLSNNENKGWCDLEEAIEYGAKFHKLDNNQVRYKLNELLEMINQPVIHSKIFEN
jgi:hypothetical protein